MQIATCTVQVGYYEAPEPGFSYSCISCAPAWHVSVDGTISPPRRSRVIELVVGESSRIEFAGIRISTHHAAILNSNLSYLNQTDVIVTPTTFPSTSITLEDPFPTSGGQEPPVRVFYSVAVRLLKNGSVHWDDPRIYNPPDQ